MKHQYLEVVKTLYSENLLSIKIFQMAQNIKELQLWKQLDRGSNSKLGCIFEEHFPNTNVLAKNPDTV